MCARVAQWWSIALPRRGSRVRIPSRALKEIEKRVIRWMALFSMFESCRARTVRMSTLRSSQANVPRTFCDVSCSQRDTKKDIRWMALFSMFESCRVRTVRMSTFHSGRRSRTSPGRSATSHSRLDEVTLDTSRALLPL